jgi:hypothetical protein
MEGPYLNTALSNFEKIKLWVIGISSNSKHHFGTPIFEMRDACSASMRLLTEMDEVSCELAMDLHAQIVPFKQRTNTDMYGVNMLYDEYMYTRFDTRFKLVAICKNINLPQNHEDSKTNDEMSAMLKLKEKISKEFIKLRFLFEQYCRGIEFQWDNELGNVVFQSTRSIKSGDNSHVRTNAVARGAENTGVLLRKGKNMSIFVYIPTFPYFCVYSSRVQKRW